MRKILAATLVMMMALMGMMASAAAAELPVLRVGMECAYAPYNWTQAEPSEYAVPLAAGGYADGYDVQVARYLADQLGMQLEIVKTEWDGLIPALTSGTGKIDAIVAGMSPTAARREVVAFTDPYYESDVVVVVRQDGPFANATSIQELAGARITGQLNTFHYDLIEQIEGVDRQVAMGDFPVMVAALSGVADVDAVAADDVDLAVGLTTGREEREVRERDAGALEFDEAALVLAALRGDVAHLLRCRPEPPLP